MAPMKFSITLLFVIQCAALVAQQRFFDVKLVDADYPEQPVRNAQVIVEMGGRTQLVVSSDQGRVRVQSTTGTVALKITHVAYHELDTTLTWSRIRNRFGDTAYVTLNLTFRSVVGKEVVIQNSYEPVRMFGSERVSVEDFELLDDDRLLLLTYERTLKRGSELLLTDFNEKIIAQLPTGPKTRELIRDFRGNIHLITEDWVYNVKPEEDFMRLFRIEKPYFMRYVAPLIDTVDMRMFFSNYSEVYPAVDYFYFDRLDSVYAKIIEVEDAIMMEMYLAEYKWVDVRTKLWAREQERKLGVDKEIIIGATIFTQSIFYKEIYAPLFVRNDSVFVFDHYKDLLYIFDDSGAVLDSLSITHHLQPKKTGWKNRIIQDQSTGEFFALYEKAGHTTLRRIDVQTGQTKESIQLHYKYVDKLMLRNNTAFYTYRPFESAQKKFLYQEKLPFQFSTGKLPKGDW
jgi:hypothetical protein